MIGLTMETMHILQSCACTVNGNCHSSAAAESSLNDAPLNAPSKIDIFAQDKGVSDEEVEEPIDPNTPFPQRIQASFAKYAQTPFTGYCPGSTSTFQLQGTSGVKWVSEFTRGGHQHRAKAMQCLLARAVARHPEWPNFMLRVAESDVKQPYTLVPATRASNSRGSVFAFPDHTWESWPEVGDFSSHQSSKMIIQTATELGLPGTPEWATKRDPRAMWRGSVLSLTRKAALQSAKNRTDLFDFDEVNFVKDQLDPEKRVSRKDQCRYRFLVHFNGLKDENSSPTLKWRMLCGSLVFLQTDPTFYEWWNVGMQPYVHFVPFATADDLVERVEEYTKKPDEAATIAAAGYELAKRAFREMDDYVDEFLVQYRNATTGLNQRICTSKGGDRATVTEHKTLEQIQQESKADPAGGYCL
jgi:hypothetical protein